MINPESDRIPHILALLGPAVLLPWPAGRKGSHRKWSHFQLTDMSAPSHLSRATRMRLGRVATEQERQFVFDRWCRFARPFWRHSRDDYYAEFLDACHYARIGLDQNPIELAVSRARSGPLPQVAGFTDERIRLLVAICREMQQITGANPFFLPTRKLGEILGAHFTQVARWLRILERPLQVIHLASGEVRLPGGSRSPRYYYGPPTRNTLGFLPTVKAVQATPLQSPLLNCRQVSNALEESIPVLDGVTLEDKKNVTALGPPR
jgi:hypothetical protein